MRTRAPKSGRTLRFIRVNVVFYQSFPSVGAFGAFLALKLSRSQRLWQGAGAVHSQHLSLHVDGARRTPNIFLYDWRGTATITTASTPRATRRRGVRYARGPRRTLCSHHCQRAPRKLSVHAVVLCASCSPLYCPGASRPRGKRAVVLPHAFGLPAIVAGWTWCATSTEARHRQRQQILRRQRYTARRIGGCDKHCEYNDAQPDRFSHGQRGRDVRYADTIINAHHVR